MTSVLEPRAISYRAPRADGGGVDLSVEKHTLPELSENKPGVQPVPPAGLAPGEKADRFKILLLDDDADFRDVIGAALVANFHEVTEVPNGVDGLRAVMKDTFDLIVCDMMMPKLGGEMFYWAVTRVRPAARLRFIFVTGHKNDPKVLNFFERIHATVLYKPFSIEALHAAIREVDGKLR